MNKTLKKTLSIILTIVMIVTTIPFVFAADTVTVYLKNAAGWRSTLYAFCWKDNGEVQPLGSWPGTLMDEVEGESQLYAIDVPTDIYAVIFNDGGLNMTPDLFLPTDGANCYNNGTEEWYKLVQSDGTPLTIDVANEDDNAVHIGNGQEYYDEDGYILTGSKENADIFPYEGCTVTFDNLTAKNFNPLFYDETINVILKGNNEIKNQFSVRKEDYVISAVDGGTLKVPYMSTDGNDGTVTVNSGNIILDRVTEDNSPTIACAGGFIINGGTVTASNNYFYVVDGPVTLNGGELNIISTSADFEAINNAVTMEKGALLTVSAASGILSDRDGAEIVMADGAEENDCFFVRYDTESEFVPASDIEAALDSKTYAEIKIDSHSHSFADGTCGACGYVCPHENETGESCTVCGTELTTAEKDYYLVGYINGANYGFEEDWENLGEYKFVDGKLTAKFDSDSYVIIKNAENSAWYYTKTYSTEQTVTLYNMNTYGDCYERLYVPADKTLEFTLVVNGDDTLTLSYNEVDAACSHSGGEATCTAKAVCDLCGEEYGEVVADAHDWSNLDGICANGCGLECDHAEQTGETCTVCGASLHTCDFSGEWKYDADKHWKECDCGLTSEEGKHTGGTATCTEKAVCETCGESYGEALGHTPDENTTYTVNDDGTHSYACSVCEETVTEDHDFGSGNTCICGSEVYFTGMNVVDNEISGEWYYDESTGVYICIILPDDYSVAFPNVKLVGKNLEYLEADNELLMLKSNSYLSSYGYYETDLIWSLEVLIGEDFIMPSWSDMHDGSWDEILYSNDGGNTWSDPLRVVARQSYYVTVNASENGSVTAKEYAIAGETVTLNVSPAKGYMLDTVTVTDADGSPVAVENNRFTMPASAVTVTATFVCDHSGGKATCTEKAVCTACGEEYGDIDADAHDWSNKDGICANGCDVTCAHDNYTDGVCDTCGLECPHESYTKGKCDVCEYPCFHSFTDFTETVAPKCEESGWEESYCDYGCGIKLEQEIPALEHDWVSGGIERPTQNIDGSWSDGYYYDTCKNDATHINKTGVAKRGDYDTFNALLAQVKGYQTNAALTDEAVAKANKVINSNWMFVLGYIPQNLIENELNAYIGQLKPVAEVIEAGIADGTMLKADYTAIDEAIAEIEEKLTDENITDEGKAGLEEIKAQLEAMKADENTSVADVAELEKALEDYDAELDSGIEDGTLVKVDGYAILGEYFNGLAVELIEKYGEDKCNEVMNSLSEEIMAEEKAIEEAAMALTGTVAENADKISELKERLKAIFDMAEICLVGTHSYKYEITTPAKCEVNAKETGICWVCGATDEREVEGTALDHSFTKYEEVTAPECGKAGLEKATCDNGCGETDEKEIPALEHEPLAAVVENEVAPGCDVEGSYDNVVYCGVCGEELSRETITVDALGHGNGKEYTENYVAPTCDEAGYYDIVIRCEDCGEVLDSTPVVVDALGHADENGDNICDNGGEELPTTSVEDCDCLCHADGFFGAIFSFLIKLFARVFQTDKVCDCGVLHY